MAGNDKTTPAWQRADQLAACLGQDLKNLQDRATAAGAKQGRKGPASLSTMAESGTVFSRRSTIGAALNGQAPAILNDRLVAEIAAYCLNICGETCDTKHWAQRAREVRRAVRWARNHYLPQVDPHLPVVIRAGATAPAIRGEDTLAVPERFRQWMQDTGEADLDAILDVEVIFDSDWEPDTPPTSQAPSLAGPTPAAADAVPSRTGRPPGDGTGWHTPPTVPAAPAAGTSKSEEAIPAADAVGPATSQAAGTAGTAAGAGPGFPASGLGPAPRSAAAPRSHSRTGRAPTVFTRGTAVLAVVLGAVAVTLTALIWPDPKAPALSPPPQAQATLPAPPTPTETTPVQPEPTFPAPDPTTPPATTPTPRSGPSTPPAPSASSPAESPAAPSRAPSPQPPRPPAPAPQPVKYWVDTFKDGPGRAGPSKDTAQVGTLSAGKNYVWCKKLGGQVTGPEGVNNYWLFTDLDTGARQGWVSAYYLKNWGDNQALDNDGNPLPDCP
ncbi:hypothetical protein [Streptomyces sp. AP-93]|uniref:hypothetical protein n=1 Tax=Streptomyces sp. AP-93 TaxID=2929048 RepID=UPI001FAFE151|nr:hypothetical protein [Streptomyces sp. AP-93]MCJ0875269.1 hypothetical protein [Streptomyces sp. AP-93]